MIVDFYLIPGDNQAAVLRYACELISRGYQQQHRYYVHTEDQKSAEALDELLWVLEPASFVPHQLAGEHEASQAPIVIGWQLDVPRLNLPTLVNLAPLVPAFASNFRNIIDITGQDATKLEQGRARYRSYKSLGCTINYHDCRKSEYAND